MIFEGESVNISFTGLPTDTSFASRDLPTDASVAALMDTS